MQPMSAATLRDSRGGTAVDRGGVELGLEPPIEAGGRTTPRSTAAGFRCAGFAATLLVGVSGAALIGAAIYAALDRQATVVQAPEYAADADRAAARPGRGAAKGRSAHPLGRHRRREAEPFKAPVTLNVGDKQVIRLQGFTHVATTLTLAPTGLADQVPAFNPLKLLADDDQIRPTQPSIPGRRSTTAMPPS